MNQLRIVRRDHDRWKPADVLCQSLVGLVVALELLLGATLHPAAHTLFGVEAVKIPLDQHEGFAVGDVLGINGIEIALAKAQIVHCVKHIGLPAAVVSKEAIHLRTEAHIRAGMVFEMNQMKMFEPHGANFLFLASVTQISWRRKRTKKKQL